MKLFIIDDSTVNNIFLQSILEENGYIVDSAISGEEALRKIETFVPDVILLDLMMPGMSGIDLLKKFREMELDIPVVIISAYKEYEYQKKTLELGAKEFFLKPLDKDKLISYLERL